VRFSIVTPSFQQPDWLRLCARSVGDQGADLEHLIQDAGTGGDLEAWVRAETRAQIFVERDHGIYDALNRGFERANGEIFAWLNCDEQYLPGALAAVAARFAAEPELDVLLADNLVLDPSGAYLAHRFSLRPKWSTMWLRFPVASCALFFRPRVWRRFDTRWRSAGDWWWFRELMRAGARIGVLRHFTSAFTETGKNLGLADVTLREQAEIAARMPARVRALRPLLLAQHRLRMLASGAWSVRPFRYAVFTQASGAARVTQEAARPTASWRRGARR
jgi:glycosyltransferase involved in cell wall biosynthesis